MADEYIRLSGKPATVAPKEDAPEKEEFIKLTKPKPFESTITKTSQTVAPYVGRAAVEGLPLAGSFYGPLGTLAGTSLKTLAKSFRPDLFGEAPATVTDLATDTGKELLFNNALPKLITGLGKISLMRDFSELGPKAATALKLKDFPAVREGAVKQLTNQMLGQYQPESQIIEAGATKAAEKFGDLSKEVKTAKQLHPSTPFWNAATGETKEVWGPEVQTAMDHLSDIYGKNKVGQMLVNLHKEVKAGTDIARTQTYKEISNTVLGDLMHVRNAKLAAGPEFTDQLARNRLLTSGFDESGEVFSAKRMLNEMGKKNTEIYTEAMTPESYREMTSFLIELGKWENKSGGTRLLNYANNKLTWAGVGAAEMLGMHGAAPVAGAIVITNKILRKWMSDPATAELVTKALQTPRAAPEAGIITKALARSLQIGADWATVPEQ